MQPFAGIIIAVIHQRRDFPDVVDILERIGVEQNQIRQFAGFYGPKVLFPPQEARWVGGGRPQSLYRGKTGPNVKLQLVVEAKTREAERVQYISARNDVHARAAHGDDKFQVLLKLPLAEGVVLLSPPLKVRGAAAPESAHAAWHVFQSRVVTERSLVTVAQAAKHRERGALPCAVFLEARKKLRGFVSIIAAEQSFAQSALPRAGKAGFARGQHVGQIPLRGLMKFFLTARARGQYPR